MIRRPIYIGPDAEAMPAGANRADRRKLQRERRLAARRIVLVQPLTEADIPPGSLLSEWTLEDIRAGKFGMALEKASPRSRRRRRTR